MDLLLKGKTALITGSSKGIGFGISQRLHSEGCRVALNGRNEQALNAATAKLKGSMGIQGDMSDPDQAGRVFETFQKELGDMDILVCNVGSGSSVPPGTESGAEWERMLRINFFSATNIIEASRGSLARTKGSIVCISSICGVETVPRAPVTYSVAKAALNAYVKGLSRPFGELGIRINAVAPGNILFEGSVWHKKLNENERAVHEMLDKNVALEKLGTPEDIASAVAFLVSPHSRFTTGSVWTIDGGQTH